MSVIVVAGVPPYDGEYELNEKRAWTTREWRIIKLVSGYMPATINTGYDGADPDLWVALTVIAMAREGRITADDCLKVADTLSDVPWDGANVTVRVEEPDPVPLALTSAPAARSRSGPLENPSSPQETPNGSGTSSPNGSGTSGTTPQVIGLLRSGTSSI